MKNFCQPTVDDLEGDKLLLGPSTPEIYGKTCRHGMFTDKNLRPQLRQDSVDQLLP